MGCAENYQQVSRHGGLLGEGDVEAASRILVEDSFLRDAAFTPPVEAEGTAPLALSLPVFHLSAGVHLLGTPPFLVLGLCFPPPTVAHLWRFSYMAVFVGAPWRLTLGGIWTVRGWG